MPTRPASRRLLRKKAKPRWIAILVQRLQSEEVCSVGYRESASRSNLENEQHRARKRSQALVACRQPQTSCRLLRKIQPGSSRQMPAEVREAASTKAGLFDR